MAVWANSGTYTTPVPPVGFQADGFIPGLPMPATYLNWILNKLDFALAAEHDPVTGEHTDITADSLTMNDPLTSVIGYSSAKYVKRMIGIPSEPAIIHGTLASPTDVSIDFSVVNEAWSWDLNAMLGSVINSDNLTALFKWFYFAKDDNSTGTYTLTAKLKGRDITDNVWTTVDTDTYDQTGATGTPGLDTIALAADRATSLYDLWILEFQLTAVSGAALVSVYGIEALLTDTVIIPS